MEGGLTWGLEEPGTTGELEQHQPVGPVPRAEVTLERGRSQGGKAQYRMARAVASQFGGSSGSLEGEPESRPD